MPWVPVFLTLVALSLAGVVADVLALRARVLRGVSRASLGMKAFTLLSFVAWRVYFGAVPNAMYNEFADLATFALLVVASVPVLLACVVCDVVALRAYLRARRGRAGAAGERP